VATAVNITSEILFLTGAVGVLGAAINNKLYRQSAVGLLSSSCDELDLGSESESEEFFRANKLSVVFHLVGWVAGIQGNLHSAASAYAENNRLLLAIHLWAAKR
jgi:GDP-L-fucose synthase